MTMIAETAYSLMYDQGKIGAKGADSIIDAAAIAGGLVLSGVVKPDDAKELYLAYRAGFSSEIMSADDPADNEKIKNSVSCFKTFLLPAVLKHPDLQGRVLAIRGKLDTKARAHSSAYNALVVCNRLQKASATPITDEAILVAVSKKSSDEKDLVAKLEAVKKTLIKIDELGTTAAVAKIDERIHVLKLMAIKAGQQQDNEEEVEEEELADA